MKIAILSTPAAGGAAIAAFGVHHALQEAGHDSVVCLLETNEAQAVSLSWPGPRVTERCFWGTSLFAHWKGLIGSDHMREGATELFSDSTLALHALSPQALKAITQADVINLHWMAGILPSPELLALLAGKKIVLTLHDMNPLTGGCHYHISCRRFEDQCGSCPLLEHSYPEDLSYQGFALKKHIYELLKPTIITPSAWLAEQARASALLGAYPVSVIANSHNLDIFKPRTEEERRQLRQQMGLREDSLVLMSASGELDNPRKNLPMLYDACRILYAKTNHPVEVLLAGYGELPPDVRGCCVGHPNEPAKMAELYNTADLFVHPSLIDNLPNTVCEAQCCGTPVIAFNASGNAETFLPGESGFLVERISAQCLADKLVEILNMPEQLMPMRASARMFAERKFGKTILAEKYLQVFADAVASEHIAMPPHLNAQLQQNRLSSLASLLRISALQTQTKISYLEQNLFGVTQKIAGVEQEISTTKQALDKAEQEISTTKQALDKAEQEISTTKQALDEAEQEISTTKQASRKTEEQIYVIMQRVATLEQRLAEAETNPHRLRLLPHP